MYRLLAVPHCAVAPRDCKPVHVYSCCGRAMGHIAAGSRLPRIDHAHSHTLRVGYIPGRDAQTVHEGRSCDEGVTIGAKVRHVKRRASLGDSGVHR